MELDSSTPPLLNDEGRMTTGTKFLETHLTGQNQSDTEETFEDYIDHPVVAIPSIPEVTKYRVLQSNDLLSSTQQRPIEQ